MSVGAASSKKQSEGRFHLIDSAGVVITDEKLGRYADLPLVIGDGAQTAAASLMTVLAREPDLLADVRAAVRVGERRWDIVFRNGLRARLPEEGEARAWHRLATLVRNHDLMARAVHVVDLRKKDRLILRLTDEAAEVHRLRMSLSDQEGAV
ncbi:MAG: cell division protein FtsQ [Alphaproteobacteria bacterium]|nr:MAG: cell division protein FtsQ [Alphaproteobacteria bacterium]